MVDENKRNLQYFDASSMKELFNAMQAWQFDNEKRFLSISVEKDGDKFCCIALTNPSEVVITNHYGSHRADVVGSALQVKLV